MKPCNEPQQVGAFPGTSRASRYRTGSSRRLALTLLACLSGGTMFTTCQARLRDATVQASKDLLASLLDPSAIVDALFGTDSNPGG